MLVFEHVDLENSTITALDGENVIRRYCYMPVYLKENQTPMTFKHFLKQMCLAVDTYFTSTISTNKNENNFTFPLAKLEVKNLTYKAYSSYARRKLDHARGVKIP